MILPLIIIVVGLLGGLLNRKENLILTDNRARLLTGSLGMFVAIIFMFQVAPTGVAFFPDTDPQQVWVTLEGALGTNVETSDQVAKTAHDRILNLLNENAESESNVKNVSVNVGVSGDAQFGGGASSPERSRISLSMVDYEDREETSSMTMTKLRDQLQGIPGTEISVDKNQMGPPTGAPVNIEISGDDFPTIRRITKDVKQLLTEASQSGEIPGLVDIMDDLNEGRPELQVLIDRERAAQFGLNTSQIATVVRAAINGIEASKYRTGEDEYDITVRLKEADRQTLESVKNLTVLYEGQQIPIAAIAGFEVRSGLGSITRLDMQRVSTVQGQAAPGFEGPAVLAQVQQHLAQYEQSMPPGYTLSYTGASQEQDEAFGFLTTVLLVALGLIFMIMVAQFNNVSSPFIIMVAVGFSLIGVLLGLIITRTPFGLFTFIGVISLAGIVVNNNIVLIDYTMQLRNRGFSKKDAIIEAGATRLRPVVLTALTTVIGLIPLTFGINIDFVGLLTDFNPNFQFGSENTQFWGPMGTSIIAGLTFATFLTMVIVPVMYSTFDSIAAKLGDVFGRKEKAEDEVHGELAYATSGNGAVQTTVLE
jgi:multidrug efflux pump subunit AcrB